MVETHWTQLKMKAFNYDNLEGIFKGCSPMFIGELQLAESKQYSNPRMFEENAMFFWVRSFILNAKDEWITAAIYWSQFLDNSSSPQTLLQKMTLLPSIYGKINILVFQICTQTRKHWAEGMEMLIPISLFELQTTLKYSTLGDLGQKRPKALMWNQLWITLSLSSE